MAPPFIIIIIILPSGKVSQKRLHKISKVIEHDNHRDWPPGFQISRNITSSYSQFTSWVLLLHHYTIKEALSGFWEQIFEEKI